jgi:predicted lactoylglutathione lyase
MSHSDRGDALIARNMSIQAITIRPVVRRACRSPTTNLSHVFEVMERNMSKSTGRKMFVNLAVRDLTRAKTFFSALGLDYNPKFTDDKAACMVVSDEAYVMLLAEPFFKTFTKRETCDTSRQTEALIALSCESRNEVDELVKKAIDAGGRDAMPAQDHGFMYGRSFYDLDGHHWEVLWMDPRAVELGPEAYLASQQK